MARTSNDLSQCRQPTQNAPCCPDCGALECLCRPRFFAGQLLSEQDLNRLDSYIRAKHRLHTRHLHGWGVVNGLAVVCDPCDQILVTQGYAVDPCGTDIVLCEETKVDICELIRKCRQADPKPPCEPFRRPPTSDCDDIEEHWVLTVEYAEWATRGITALRGNSCGPSGSACDCGSGGGSSCTCGDNGKSSRSAPGVSPRNAPQQCEPTQTCEGYRFGVYPKPVEDDDDDDDDRLFSLDGSFWDQFNCCVEPLISAIPPMPDLRGDDTVVNVAIAISQWCCQFRQNLLDYFQSHRNTSCEIIDYLRAINCPNISSPGSFWVDFLRSFLQLIAAWAEGLKNCFCLALLPPTPQATDDVRVPLASVRIRARDCKILSICNLTRERKMLVSWPAVMHWMSIVPIADLIRDLMDRLCCNSLLDIFDEVLRALPKPDVIGTTSGIEAIEEIELESLMMRMEGQPKSAGKGIGGFAAGLHLASGTLAARITPNLDKKIGSFSKLADGMIERGGEPIELGSLLNAVSPRFKLPENGQKLSDVEVKNLPTLVLSEVMIKPVLGNFIGNKEAGSRIDEYQQELMKKKGQSKKEAKKGASGQSVEMQLEVDQLREQLKAQEAQIEILSKKLDG